MIPMVHYYKNMVAIRISFIFKSTVSITNLHIYQYVAICPQTSLNPKHPNSCLNENILALANQISRIHRFMFLSPN